VFFEAGGVACEPEQPSAPAFVALREARASYAAGSYRDGVEAGKHDTIQAGFNDGFLQGSRAGFVLGQARAALQ
jgi:flagellar biosynthesis/type III secretory pathway protein FliH